MKLAGWLSANEVDEQTFATRIGRSREAVRRYVNGERIPDRETMPLIARATKGEVTANDFFDLVAAVRTDTPALDAAA